MAKCEPPRRIPGAARPSATRNDQESEVSCRKSDRTARDAGVAWVWMARPLRSAPGRRFPRPVGRGKPRSGPRDFLLDSGEAARPGLALAHLGRQVADGGAGAGLIGEAAGGDHEQRLALLHLAVIAVVAAQLTYEVAGGLFGADRQNLQRVALAGLRQIPVGGRPLDAGLG